jgi:hypothetical protein
VYHVTRVSEKEPERLSKEFIRNGVLAERKSRASNTLDRTVPVAHDACHSATGQGSVNGEQASRIPSRKPSWLPRGHTIPIRIVMLLHPLPHLI